MQSKDEIEKSYEKPDPWGYQSSSEDKKRKNYLVGLAGLFCRFDYGIYGSGLDICCGEGWITGSLPVGEILEGIELSDTAAARFPPHVKRVSAPRMKYDFVMATGCLYPHYDWRQIVLHINRATKSGSIILISNIEAWEHQQAIESITGRQIFEARFPYNEHHQKVRVFEV